METSFKLNAYHFNVFRVILQVRELGIQGDSNFSFELKFGGNCGGEVTDQKASISPMFMIKA